MKSVLPNSWKAALEARGLWPRSATAHFTLYLVALAVIFQLVSRVWSNFSATASVLSLWTGILTLIATLLLLFLVLRWSRRYLLWRLRNRLIVTYMFIGVIPVVLILAIVFIAGYLFAGQFATFIAVEAIDEQVYALEHANTDVALDLASALNAGAPFTSPALRKVSGLKHLGGRFQHTDLVASDGSKNIVLVSWQPHSAEEIYVPEWLTSDFSGVVVDHGFLSLRSAVKVSVRDKIITVIASAPMEGPLAEAIANKAGEIQILPKTEEERGSESSKQPNVGPAKPRKQVKWSQATGKSIRAGVIPPARGFWDREVNFLTSIKSISWPTGPQAGNENLALAAVLVGTRISALYSHLFSNLGQFANYAVFILLAIATIFGFIEFLALLIGIRLTRTMTRSVSNLYQATEHVNRGDLRYRIEVSSNDQMATLQRSFNSMSASIEKLLQEQKEKERLQSELEIAQEVQAQLFPHTSKNIPGLEVHGICKAARTVSGDYYDFLRLGDGKLGLAMGDISGKGISAALLMATIHSAVRVYELGRMPEREELVAAGAAAPSSSNRTYNPPFQSDTVESPAAILSFLNRHLYHSTPPEKYATLFLGVYDGASRTLTYSNGGHLPPLLIAEDASTRELTVGGTVIGLLDYPTWEEQCVQMHRGEILVAFSDGLTEPENEFGEFGEERLVQIVRENRRLPLERISELVLTAVQDWIGDQEQADDMTLVLARAL